MRLARRDLLCLAAGSLVAATARAAEPVMAVVLLGTGSPVLSMERMGPATLVQAGGLNLLFDAGRGAAIRLTEAGVPVGSLHAIFLTHYHSDHVNGLSDVWMSGYVPAGVGSRRSALQLYGPVGAKALAAGLMSAHEADSRIRVRRGGAPPEAVLIEPHEFDADGVVFERNGVRVTAFTVDHGELIRPAVGYRVDFAGRSVVLSGDTRFDPAVIRQAAGADLLVHEVVAPPGRADPASYRVVVQAHTLPEDAGRVFAAARPRLAVYSHIVFPAVSGGVTMSLKELEARTRRTYDGPLVIGRDLMRFEIGDRVRLIGRASGGR